jgi:hypothetical protein
MVAKSRFVKKCGHPPGLLQGRVRIGLQGASKMSDVAVMFLGRGMWVSLLHYRSAKSLMIGPRAFPAQFRGPTGVSVPSVAPQSATIKRPVGRPRKPQTVKPESPPPPPPTTDTFSGDFGFGPAPKRRKSDLPPAAMKALPLPFAPGAFSIAPVPQPAPYTIVGPGGQLPFVVPVPGSGSAPYPGYVQHHHRATAPAPSAGARGAPEAVGAQSDSSAVARAIGLLSQQVASVQSKLEGQPAPPRRAASIPPSPPRSPKRPPRPADTPTTPPALSAPPTPPHGNMFDHAVPEDPAALADSPAAGSADPDDKTPSPDTVASPKATGGAESYVSEEEFQSLEGNVSMLPFGGKPGRGSMVPDLLYEMFAYHPHPREVRSHRPACELISVPGCS